jgi:hypothetical protein
MRIACLSLHQPWASALFLFDAAGRRLKIHETRSFPAPRRLIGQRIAIHAAKKRPGPELSDSIDRALPAGWRDSFPFGAVLGTVQLVSCTEMNAAAGYHIHAAMPGLPDNVSDSHFGLWAEGRFALRTEQPALLPQPIPWRGLQGWFNVEIP